MQSLDVISVNIWNILIALCNLLLLFLLLKKFLYKPVRKVLKERQDALDKQYSDAMAAQAEADENRRSWDEKMLSAQAEADRIVKKGVEKAEDRSSQIISEAKDKADIIMREAEAGADLERKKAQADIKSEIIDVSALLTEKVLQRNISKDDHRAIIDSVISEMGEDND